MSEEVEIKERVEGISVLLEDGLEFKISTPEGSLTTFSSYILDQELEEFESDYSFSLLWNARDKLSELGVIDSNGDLSSEYDFLVNTIVEIADEFDINDISDYGGYNEIKEINGVKVTELADDIASYLEKLEISKVRSRWIASETEYSPKDIGQFLNDLETNLENKKLSEPTSRGARWLRDKTLSAIYNNVLYSTSST